MKLAKERIIYNNYDLDEDYPDDEVDEILIENGVVESKEDITEEMRWDERYFSKDIEWDDTKAQLDEFFDGKTVLFIGETGLWHGVYRAGAVGEFWDLYNKALTDCDYVKIYDENGHFYISCSHHDGSCHYEVKILTKEGEDYLERWEDNWDDRRSEGDVHHQIFKRYSHIPRFAEKVYGYKAREYEESTKASIINKLANEARSYYSGYCQVSTKG